MPNLKNVASGFQKEVSSIVNARRTATDEDKHRGDLKRKANSLYNI